jgi:PAS domain-containing protein
LDKDAAARSGLKPERLAAEHAASPLFSAMGLQLLQDVFTHAPAAIAVTRGPEHLVEFVNPTWVQASGRSDAGAFLGKPIRHALPEVERRYTELMDQSYRTGEPFTAREAHVRLDRAGNGELTDAYFNFLYHPVRGSTGAVDGMIIYAVDVTEQVQARKAVEREAALREQQRDHLMQILDTLPVAVIVTDEEGRIVTRNWVGRSLSSPLKKRPTKVAEFGRRGVRRMDGSPYTVEELPQVRSLRTGEVITGEHMLLPVAGRTELVPVLVNSAPLLDRQAGIIGAVVAYSDISAIKELERQKDDFFGAAAHDLRTPVTSIKGLVQLLERRLKRSGKLPEHVRQTIERICWITPSNTALKAAP